MCDGIEKRVSYDAEALDFWYWTVGILIGTEDGFFRNSYGAQFDFWNPNF